MSPDSPAAWPDNLPREDAFDDAWQRYYLQGGEIPRLSDFLPRPGSDDAELLTVHLIEIDLERRWCAAQFEQRARGLADTSFGLQETRRNGQAVRPQPVVEYLRQLNWPANSEWIPDLLEAEYEVRRRAGQAVSSQAYFQKWPLLQDQLREKFSAVDEALRQEKLRAEPDEALPEIPGFQIERVLGRGGMGVVYLARELAMHRQVAIKYADRVPRDAYERARYDLESIVQAQFTHEHVVGIHGKGVHQGRPYLICDYVAGQSLKEAIKDKPLAPEAAARLIAHVARTLHDVHEAGIVHRDLKPENILLDKKGTPLVADFGIAKLAAGHELIEQALAGAGELTMQGDVIGTPAYMSPEQAAGLTGHDRRTDVYGLGALLYAVLIGRPPFLAATRDEILQQVRNDDPLEPRKVNGRLPRDLNTICLKCLSKNPNRRYATALELADDLERFLRGEPIQARPVRRVERAIRWCGRNRIVASLLAVVTILFLLATTASAYYVHAAFEMRDRLDQEQIGVAHQLIQRSNVGGALRLLESIWSRGDSFRTDGFAWDFALRQCHSEARASTDFPFAFAALAVSPDGKTIALATAEGQLRIGQAASGERIATASLGLPVSSLTFNHDGSRLAVTTGDGVISIWKLDGERCESINKYTEHLMPVQSVVFHPNENLIASVSEDAGVRLWEADSGLTLLKQTDELTCFVSSMQFAGDGKSLWVLASGQSEAAGDGLWQLDLHSEQFEQLPIELLAPAAEERVAIRRAALSLDGNWLLVLGSDRRLRGFRFADLGVELKWTAPVARADSRFVIARDWFGLFDSSSRAVMIYSLEHGQPLRTIRGHTDRLTAAAVSHDGSLLAVAARNRVLKIWNGNEDTDGPTLRGHQGWIKVLALSPDGKTLASGGNDQGVYVWDVQSGRALYRLGKHEVINAPTADGTPGAVRRIATFSGHQAFISGIGFSPDNERVLTLGEDSRLMVWNRESGKQIRDIPLRVPQPRGLAVHPRRSEAAFFSMHGNLYFFDYETGAQTGELKLPGYAVQSLAYAPDGSALASGDKDGTIRLWNDQTREEQLALRGLEASVQRIVFNRAGSLLAAADAQGAIRVWRLPDPEPILAIEGASDRNAGLAFLPDDQLIITTGGLDELGTLKIWDITTDQELMSLAGDYTQVIATPDGTRIAAALGKWYTVRLLDSRPIDAQAYRRQPVPLAPPPAAAEPMLGKPPPLRALGYFVAEAIPFLNDSGDDDVLKASPLNSANRYVAVKLIVPQALEMATEAEFEKYYKEWVADGTAPIERDRASLQLPSRFTLHAGDGSKYTGKLHGSWPLVRPSLGFRRIMGVGRHFAEPRPLQRGIYFAIFEVPRDVSLSDLKIQMRDDPPIEVPNEPLPAPAVSGKAVRLK